MAAIKEILEFETIRDGEQTRRSIHLFQEGSFYRAYEWSAWLMCRYIHEFKVTHRRMKGVDQTVTLIGFPVTSLSKWFGESVERHNVSDKHLLFHLPEGVFSDLSDGDSVVDIFNQWKSQLPLSVSNTKTSAAIAAESSKHLSAVVSLTSVAQRIMSFPIEKKSPIECYQFISEIKQQLAMLY